MVQGAYQGARAPHTLRYGTPTGWDVGTKREREKKRLQRVPIESTGGTLTYIAQIFFGLPFPLPLTVNRFMDEV